MPLSDSTFVIRKNSSGPNNSSLTVRTKNSSAKTSVKYINYQLVTIPGTFKIGA